MLRVDMLPAQQGDALWIEWGEPDRPHRLLLDAGTAPTFTVLRERIETLPREQRHFELLLVSHVDNDHIAGALPLLEDAMLGTTFADVWFNGYRHLPRTAVQTLGPVEGERLTELLRKRDWNAAFDGGAVVVAEEGTLPTRELAGGLTLTLLSPCVPQLAALRDVWIEAIRAAGLDPAEPEPEPPPEPPPGIQALGGAEPDIARLAQGRFDADSAKPNGSSIAVLAEHEGSSVLLAADAFPAVVLANVKRLLIARDTERLALSGFKLPHHGSRANIDLPLLEALESDRFLLSTNGAHTRHPHEQSIAQVLMTHEKPELAFNYRSKYNEVWRNRKTAERLGYTSRCPSEGEAGLAVLL